MTEHLLLIGMMGAGKSSVSSRVAAELGLAVFDSDAMVEAATDLTVSDLFERDGEPGFRKEEAKALAIAVASPAPAVIAVAGGAVLDEANRRLIGGAGLVVWLRARVETLVARVGSGRGRPLLAEGSAVALAALDEARRPFYTELADTIVDVDELDPSAVAAVVISQWRAR